MQEQLTRYQQPSPAQDKIAAVGLEAIIEEIEQGASISQVSKRLGVSYAVLHGWLHRADRSARVIAAQEAGAEHYEQQAVDILRDTYDRLDSDVQHPNGGALASLARERAQAAWRQASVRDPRRYSDRRSTDITVTHKHDVRELTTAELERLVASEHTLTLDNETSEVSG